MEKQLWHKFNLNMKEVMGGLFIKVKTLMQITLKIYMLQKVK